MRGGQEDCGLSSTGDDPSGVPTGKDSTTEGAGRPAEAPPAPTATSCSRLLRLLEVEDPNGLRRVKERPLRSISDNWNGHRIPANNVNRGSTVY